MAEQISLEALAQRKSMQPRRRHSRGARLR